LPNHFSHIELDYFVIMPDHLHGIILITDATYYGVGKTDAIDRVPTNNVDINVGTTSMSSAENRTHTKNPTLGTIIGTYKAAVTRNANRKLQYETRIWQERFHDHIIRNEISLNKLRQLYFSM